MRKAIIINVLFIYFYVEKENKQKNDSIFKGHIFTYFNV